MSGHFARGGLRPDHRLGLIVGARGGGKQQIEVGHRRLDAVEQRCAGQDMVGAGRRPARGDVRPAVARIDDAQATEREIAHGAGRHADVLAELRLNQNDNGAIEVEAGLGLVGA